MPFREKTAWISLACLLATFGVFFGVLSTGAIHTDGRTAAEWFVVCVGAFIALRLVLHVVVAAAAARAEARTPADERERMIALMAARNANVALMVGIVAVPLSMHLGVPKPGMGYVAMFAIVCGEVVREVSRITYFRYGG